MNFKRIIKKSTSIILALAIMVGVLTHLPMDVEAANGTWNGGHIYRDGFWLRVDWSESAKNPKTNKSTVTATVYLVQKANYSLNVGASRDVTIKIGDSTYKTKTSAAIKNSGGVTTKLGSYSTTVTHNSNGSLNVPITATFAMNATLGSTKYTTMTTTNTAVLDTLDRAAPSITTTVSNITSTSITLKGTSNTPSESWAYSKDGGNTWTSFGSAGTSTAVTVSGLNPSTTYSFKIRAKKTSNDITGISSTVLGLTLPPNASGLAVNKISDTSAKLTWKSVTGATSYNVYKNGTLLSSGIKSLQYDFDGLISGVEYNLGVSAANPSGNSGTTTIKFMLPPAGNPTNLKISSSTPNTATLTWDKVQGASSYTLYKNGKIIESDVKELDYTFTNLKHGEIALLAVHAENAGGTSDISELTYTVPPKSAPTGLSILSETEMTTTLQWDPVEGATSYIIYLDGNVLEENITETNYEYTELMGGSEHILGVVAKNNGGKTEISILEHTTRIQIPSNVKIQSQTTESVSLSWKKQGSQIHHYNIYRDGEKIGESVEPKYIDNTYGNTVSIYRVSAVTHENIETELSLEIPTLDITGPDIQFDGVESKGLSVKITTRFEDSQSGIDEKSLAWAYGEQNVEFFESNGNSFSGSHFEVGRNGIYTVFAKDKAGNSSIKTVSINGILYQSNAGEFEYSESLFTIDAPGIPMEFNQYYNSANRENGPLGMGWRLNFTSSIAVEDDYIIVNLPQGNPLIFKLSEGTYNSINSNSILYKNSDSWILKDTYYTYTFNLQGALTKVTERNGNSVSIIVDSKGYPLEIIDSVGRIYTFNYINNLLTSIEDPAGRKINYHYINGYLTSIENFKGEINHTFETDIEGRIISVKDMYQNSLYEQSYDTSHRILHQTSDKVSVQYTYSIDTSGNQSVAKDEKIITYDNQGNILKDENETQFLYDSLYKNILYEKTNDGNVTSYIYNSNGELVTQETRDSNNHIISNTSVDVTYFDNSDRIRIRVETIETINYVENEEPTKLISTITTTYDDKGNPLTIQEKSDDIDTTMSNTFGINGEVLSSIDKTGTITTFSYDKYGNPTNITTQSQNEEPVENYYTYNVIGLVLTSKTNRDVKTNFIYDELGNILRSTSKDKQNETRTTRYVYNDKGEKTHQIGSLEYQKSHDVLLENEHGISTVDSYSDRSAGIQYSYNSKGKITNTKIGAYNVEKNSNEKISKASVGNLILSEYTYLEDNEELLSTIEYGNGAVFNYKYDDRGNKTEFIVNNILQYTYTYDDENQITAKKEHIGLKHETLYKYLENNDIEVTVLKENEIVHVTLLSKDDVTKSFAISETNVYQYNFDREGIETYSINDTAFLKRQIIKGKDDRNEKEIVSLLDDNLLTKEYGYDSEGLITEYTNNFKDQHYEAYQYQHDGYGNITQVTLNDQVILNYTYDSENQLIRVDDKESNQTQVYTYDTKGNILKKEFYIFTLGSLNSEIPLGNNRYEYNNPNFPDQLTYFNGHSMSYDNLGNPTNYKGWDMSWDNARQLKSMIKDSQTLTFTYDDEGYRTSKKTGNSNSISYTTVGGLITSQINSSGDEWIFHYGEDKNLIGFSYNGNNYIYVKNIQDDVTGILDNDGNQVVSYTYDAWGKTLSIEGPLSNTLGKNNPMRYRSYYLDVETELYYLHSRYYDPEVGRFISTDDPINQNDLLEVGTILGGNLFSYSVNNPINYSDPDGKLVLALIIGGAVIGGLLGAGISYHKYKKISIKWVVGGLILGGFVGGTAGWIYTSIKGSVATWKAFKGAQIAAGAYSSSYAKGSTFEKWFYEFFKVTTKLRQVVHKGFRFDAIHKSRIFELKNYDWSKYSKSQIKSLASQFTKQIGNYSQFINSTINGQKIKGITLYFSSKPPRELLIKLEDIENLIIEWPR